jgi:hypothetical protein
VSISDISEASGATQNEEVEEVFEPGALPRPGDGAIDTGVLYTIAGAILVAVVFTLYVIFGGPSSKPPVVASPSPAPTVSVPAPPPPPPPPPPTITPVIPTTHAVLSAGPSWAHLKPVRPTIIPEGGVSDQAIVKSLQRGADWLVSQFFDGELVAHDFGDPGMFPGGDAISVYALLHTGAAVNDSRLSISDPFMRSALEHLKRLDVNNQFATYSHSLRASALAMFDRPEDRAVLHDDLQWLTRSEVGGAYSYTEPPKGQTPESFSWDNSNSQYGVLGIWAGAEAGMSAPPEYWRNVEMHWLRCQNSDGGWPYTPGRESTVTMSAAGVTTLSVAAEQLRLANAKVDQDQMRVLEALRRGLNWLGHDEGTVTDLGHGYTLYGVERAALATGLKRFGNHDWYREIAAGLVKSQNQDGSWGGWWDKRVETAFRLLLLARGRQAMAIEKLRFAGEWDNRPRDASKFAEFASQQLEQQFAWGVADFARDWSDWIDCPLLMITTDTPPSWSDSDFAKFRKYTDAGGMIFLHNENNTPEMNDFAATFAAKVFPDLKFDDIPTDHLIYSVLYNIKSKTPLKGVSDGTRTLLVYSPTDITKAWITRRPKESNVQSQLGVNLFIYTAGKSNFHGRLASPYLAPPLFAPAGTIPVVRIQYPGNWDPQPGAWLRFPRYFQNDTSLAIAVTPEPIDQLSFPAVPVAVLTGNTAVDFDHMNLAPLHDFVAAGGIVVIDAVSANKDFIKSVREQLVPKAFGDAQIQPLDPTQPVLAGTGDGMDPLPKPRLRQYAIETLQQTPPSLDLITLGKGAVIISDLDLTCGLLNTSTWGICGYEPDYANSLMKNVMLWASARYRP